MTPGTATTEPSQDGKSAHVHLNHMSSHIQSGPRENDACFPGTSSHTLSGFFDILESTGVGHWSRRRPKSPKGITGSSSLAMSRRVTS